MAAAAGIDHSSDPSVRVTVIPSSVVAFTGTRTVYADVLASTVLPDVVAVRVAPGQERWTVERARFSKPPFGPRSSMRTSVGDSAWTRTFPIVCSVCAKSETDRRRPNAAVTTGTVRFMVTSIPRQQPPSFTHQLSFEGSNGEVGGQSRVAGTSAIAWYSVLLKTTLAPFA